MFDAEEKTDESCQRRKGYSMKFIDAWPEIQAGNLFRYRFKNDDPETVTSPWSDWTTMRELASYTLSSIQEMEFEIKRDPPVVYFARMGPWEFWSLFRDKESIPKDFKEIKKCQELIE